MKVYNTYIADYEPEKDSNYLLYWGTNNLYGWATGQNLPCKMLRWDKAATLKKIPKTPDDSPKGYIAEVDIEFPQHFARQNQRVSTLPGIPDT